MSYQLPQQQQQQQQQQHYAQDQLQLGQGGYGVLAPQQLAHDPYGSPIKAPVMHLRGPVGGYGIGNDLGQAGELAGAPPGHPYVVEMR
jgi:hypothetical protein